MRILQRQHWRIRKLPKIAEISSREVMARNSDQLGSAGRVRLLRDPWHCNQGELGAGRNPCEFRSLFRLRRHCRRLARYCCEQWSRDCMNVHRCNLTLAQLMQHKRLPRLVTCIVNKRWDRNRRRVIAIEISSAPRRQKYYWCWLSNWPSH